VVIEQRKYTTWNKPLLRGVIRRDEFIFLVNKYIYLRKMDLFKVFLNYSMFTRIEDIHSFNQKELYIIINKLYPSRE
jgi:hypothetical protein